MKAYLYFEEHPYTTTAVFPVRIARSAGDAALDRISAADEPAPYYTEDDTLLALAPQTGADEANLLPKHIPDDLVDSIPDVLYFHTHGFMEITQILNTNALYFADQKIYRVNSGDLIIFNAFIPHSWIIRGKKAEIKDYSFITNSALKSNIYDLNPGGKEQNASLDVTIANRVSSSPKNWAVRTLDNVRTHEDFVFSFINSNFRCLHIKSDTEIHGILCEILRTIDAENNARNLGYEFVIRAKLMEFVAYLARFHSNVDVSTSQKSMHELTAVLKYLSENLHNKLSLQEAANRCYMTPQYFSTYFKRHVGVNFSYYITCLRVERALEYLQNTDKSILDIAIQCGFNSKSNFYRAWYTKYQISPSQVRKVK